MLGFFKLSGCKYIGYFVFCCDLYMVSEGSYMVKKCGKKVENLIKKCYFKKIVLNKRLIDGWFLKNYENIFRMFNFNMVRVIKEFDWIIWIKGYGEEFMWFIELVVGK